MSIAKRTISHHLETVSYHGGAQISHWENPPPGMSNLTIEHYDPAYSRSHPTSGNLVRPPYHWHWYQIEHFTVKQGAFIFTLDGKKIRQIPADGTIDIPVAAHHTFMADPECQEICIIQITAEPPDQGMSERFFRNIYGYLDDCGKAGLTPSLVQLLMLLDSAECSLAFPGPRWIVNPLSWLLGMVVGRWLGWVLGYKTCYPEYYDAKREWKK